MTNYIVTVNSKKEYNKRPITLHLSITEPHTEQDIKEHAEYALFKYEWKNADMPNMSAFQLSDMYDIHCLLDNDLEFEYKWDEELVNWGCNLINSCFDENFKILSYEIV